MSALELEAYSQGYQFVGVWMRLEESFGRTCSGCLCYLPPGIMLHKINDSRN